MHRFFVPASRISGGRISFSNEQRKQLRNVLRLRSGDVVTALDGSGREFVTKIEALDGKLAIGKIMETRTPSTEPNTRLTLVISLPKGERLDLILQKCTEIGAAKFLIIETVRTVRRIAPDKIPAKLDRWRTIVKEAAEQCGRTRLPTVDGVISLEDALAQVKSGTGVIAWEEEEETNLSSVLPRIKSADEITLFIGPEGGFTEEEVAAARAAGIIPVSLGPRILRTETAAIVGCTLIIYGPEG